MRRVALSITDYLSRVPRTKREVAALAGIAARDVEQLIQQARLEGAAIVSDRHGYRLTDDPVELLNCYRRLRHRHITQALTARALMRTAARLRNLVLWP